MGAVRPPDGVKADHNGKVREAALMVQGEPMWGRTHPLAQGLKQGSNAYQGA